MTRTISIILLSIALASCGRSPGPEAVTGAPADAPADAPPAASGDPCSLLDDPAAVFGQPVTASVTTMPNQTKACEWKSAEGRMCGLVTVFGAGWNDVPDLGANYSAMVSSLGAFGQTQPIAGVGEEAVAVDGKMLGAQVALRTPKAIANIGAACGGSSPANMEHAEKIARAVAGKL